MDNLCSELWGIFLFWRSMFRWQNFHNKDDTDPRREYDTNSPNNVKESGKSLLAAQRDDDDYGIMALGHTFS